MSFYYYRAPKEEEKAEGWGFKKVNSAELTGIMERITRPTYNSRMHNMECTQVHNYRYTNTNFLARRSPTSCDRRRSASALPSTGERRLNERELQRIIRRLRKPTVSYEASRYDFSADEELPLPRPLRPKSAVEDRQKAFQQLSRPTTASRAKTLGDCTLCLDREEQDTKNSLVPFEYDYADDKSVPPEELDFIVDRVSAPTYAHKKTRCPKTPKPVDEVKLRSKTPLASGLARSKTVNEIVQRLHSANRGRYRAPAATEITVFT
ncbi:uncharacterized protein LOC143292630 [Babylonia areolata]|uniref:uncharacterized protein LOC143292630 n=1 Tax=Babylonia areolata TaxID=304850 RepID=UPI003FD3F11B